ncbi:MAG: ATP-binding protein [Eubacteriaceae bacterium]|nr:ATP-binding protein [Eubacteriaceae bacterium]
MLKRKIQDQLQAWKNEPDHKPLIIKGVRQCGKTASVLAFAEQNYKNVIYMNFFENPEYSSVFAGSLKVDDLIMYMSALLGKNTIFEPGNTIIILDEIQHCPNARTSLKFFKLDGRYDVIGTGSLLGISGYGEEISIPVGYETIMSMYPMDFEEFLWANGIEQNVIDLLKRSLDTITPVPVPIHERMRDLLLQYTVVGGMPEVAQRFVDTRQISQTYSLQMDIINSYRDDMVKYASRADRSRIRECFDSIPKQLAKENKKFQYSLIRKKGTSGMYEGSLKWIEDAGIINRCYNLSLPELPLDGYAETDIFKVYMADTGLFTAMLDEGTQYDILRGDLYGYKGAVFENLIADMIGKRGKALYYFRKESGIEIDFVIRRDNAAILLEVKAKNGNAKSVKTILAHPEKYHVGGAIKLGDYNIGSANGILTLPTYMGFLII